MEGKEVPSQGLAKEVGTVLEPLRQNCPSQLLGSMRIWISPGEGKEVLGPWVDWDNEESIFQVQDCEMGGGTGDEKQESVGVVHHQVYRSHRCTDQVEILYQLVRPIRLFYWQNRSVMGEWVG
jgi:hypothetical protein